MKTLVLRIPESMHGQLKLRACQSRRSLNSHILCLIEDSFSHQVQSLREKVSEHAESDDLSLQQRPGAA